MAKGQRSETFIWPKEQLYQISQRVGKWGAGGARSKALGRQNNCDLFNSGHGGESQRMSRDGGKDVEAQPD